MAVYFSELIFGFVLDDLLHWNSEVIADFVQHFQRYILVLTKLSER